jgi:nucleoside-diphosphate-sugar epimerase
MRLLIAGAAGFIGTRLGAALLARGALLDASGRSQAISELVLADRLPPAIAADPRVRCVGVDVSDPASVEALMRDRFDVVYALAATLTVEAEADFARGLDVNLRGLLSLLEACRRQAAAPRLVFASSIAAFGGPLPETVNDDLKPTPQTSYGTHKAVGELLVDDYSRRGFIDGRSLRLPVVLVRPAEAPASAASAVATASAAPGRAAAAASAAAPTVSGAISAIVRDRLAGTDVTCPLEPATRIAAISVERVVDALIAVLELPASRFGHTRAMNLPALSVTLGELAEATDRAAREAGIAAGRLHWAPDPRYQSAVDQWPRRFVSERATRLGIGSDVSADAIVAAYLREHAELTERGQ